MCRPLCSRHSHMRGQCFPSGECSPDGASLLLCFFGEGGKGGVGSRQSQNFLCPTQSGHAFSIFFLCRLSLREVSEWLGVSPPEVILLVCNPWPTRPPAADVVAHMLQDVQPRAKRCYVPEPGKGTHADLEYRCVTAACYPKWTTVPSPPLPTRTAPSTNCATSEWRSRKEKKMGC